MCSVYISIQRSPRIYIRVHRPRALVVGAVEGKDSYCCALEPRYNVFGEEREVRRITRCQRRSIRATPRVKARIIYAVRAAVLQCINNIFYVNAR